MGFVRDVKAASMAKDAERAMAEGRMLFVARINNPTMAHQMSGSVSGVAEQLEAIEMCGWWLHHVSYCQDRKGGVEGYYVFRRRQRQ